ncbi:MAG: aryl-sulfate sulfotransferase [Lachnospiraceae bacterium]|nr:aryl-sulfate sulfotransferase [Lachnospiraceae bacterium]
MDSWKNRFAAAFAMGAVLLWGGASVLSPAGSVLASEDAEEAVVYEAAGWQISLEDEDRAASLNTVSVSLGYTSVETTDIEQSAEEGYEYCLLKLSFVKVDSTEEIDWENVSLTDGEGNSYSRIEDSFLADFGMSRLPGTNLNFGSYEGWICFGIPEEAEDLEFVCSFAEEELVIPVEFEANESEAETGTTESETGTTESETAAPESEIAAAESETAAAESETAAAENEIAAAENETAAVESETTATEAGAATETETASETETEAASEAETEIETESETETETEAETEETWTEIDYEDYLEEQSAIDEALYAEAQSGYSFEDPFVVVNPYKNSPLTAMVIFTTAEETGVEVVVCGKDDANNITASFEADTTHILPIYGLYAGETTEVVLTLDDGTSTTLEITTEALEGSLTEAEVTVYDADAFAGCDAFSENELTFACIQTVMDGDCGVVALDNAGDVRWFMDEDYISAFSMKRLANGRMMSSTTEMVCETYYYTGLVEFDLIGKFYSIYLIPGGEHHDFMELENGNLLVCSCVEDFSTVEDRIVEIDRETGEVVYELNVSDLIEQGDGGSLNASERDWCHNNAIDYDEETDTILLSCRNLDAVLAINKTEKELIWILGDPSGFTSVSEDLFFTPVTAAEDEVSADEQEDTEAEADEEADAEAEAQEDAAADVSGGGEDAAADVSGGEEDAAADVSDGEDFEWQYAQHNASFLPDGDILLFDNGKQRTKVGAEDEATSGDDVYSRAVRYHIDTETMTIEQVWSYGEERGASWYSSYISGAEYLDEDTYWITSGSNSYNEELASYDLTVPQANQGNKCTYIDLIIGDELVYEMTIPSSTYRSIRASLYTEETTYSLTEEAHWYGSLGSVAQEDIEELTVNVDGEAVPLESLLADVDSQTVENVEESETDEAGVDEAGIDEAGADENGEDANITSVLSAVSETAAFSITELLEKPDRLVISGSWPETGEDASLVLVSESGDVCRFSIAASTTSTVEGEVNFSLWITADSVEAGHRYYLYLYNNGTLYRTGNYWNVYVDTRESVEDEGAQYVLYDVDGQSYTVLSADALSSAAGIETDLETELTAPEQTQAISDAIVAEVETNGYTFNNPLVIQNPYQNTPLTAVVAFETDEACEVRVTVKGKSSAQEDQESQEGTDSEEASDAQDITDTIDADTLHIVPVLGLYAGYDNEVVLELLDSDGNVTDTRSITITTEALPSALQGEVETGTYTTESAMDLMLVSGLSAPYAYAFDETGEIRWYCTIEWEYYGLFMLENGHFLMEAENVLYPNASMPNSPEFWEMDYLGRVYNVYYFPEGVHHDIKEMTPDGNFLVLTNSNDGYEQNMIQEIDRETGEVVKSLNLNELFEGLSYIDRDDWCHTNTVSYDEATDSILISCRNLHSVIRIDWSTDEILWILADPTMWEGTGYEDKVLTATEDIQWHYQQHAAYALEEDLDGNPLTVEIMLFDNHYSAYRSVSTYDYTGSSYVKIYSVDAEAMTVTQLKNYETAYSVITSNAFYDSEENRVFSVNAYLSSSLNTTNRGQIYEIEYESGEILNTWKITHRFYRGYAISLSMNDCAGAYTLSENSIKGTLRAPVEVDSEDVVTITENETLSAETLSFTLRGGVLYMENSDHMFTQVIFNGTEHTYVYDITDIDSQSSDVDSYRYEIPIPLTTLEADTYTIQVMYDDELYNIEGSFTCE